MLARASDEERDRDDEIDRDDGIDRDVAALVVLGSPANDARYPVAQRAHRDPAPAPTLYEEFHPFGTTSYAANDAGIEVSAKRYRYIGKERDEETGLYQFGARYYASWLGRWTAADPIGPGDGVNRYSYCRGNPLARKDPSGTAGEGNLVADLVEQQGALIVSLMNAGSSANRAKIREELGGVSSDIASEVARQQAPTTRTRTPGRPANSSAAPFRGGVPPVEEAYSEQRGTFSVAYDEAVEGFSDESNPTWARAAFFGLAVIEVPVALVDKAGEALLNAPRNADLAGQFAGQAALSENPTVALERGGQAFQRLSAAFIGLGGPASLRVPSPRPTAPAATAAEGGGVQLKGSTNGELMREALELLKARGTAAEKAELFESLVPQINTRGGGFTAVRSTGTEGSEVFLGEYGEALVISPSGQVFRGSLGTGGVVPGKSGNLTPVFDKLKQIE